jgi:hypothetical protein
MGSAGRRVALVLDTTDSPNWGCRATTLALAGLIEATGHEVVGTVTSGALDVGPTTRRLGQVARGAGTLLSSPAPASLLAGPAPAPAAQGSGRFAAVQRQVDRLDDHRAPVPTRADELEDGAAAVWESHWFAPHRRTIETADVVVINGEGAIYGTERKGYLALTIAHLARRAGKPVALVNQTVELSDPGMRSLAAVVLPEVDALTFREPRSVRECRELLGDIEPRLVPDAAFSYAASSGPAWWEWASRPDAMSVYPDRLPRLEEGYVCVGGSSAFLRGGAGSIDPTASLRRIVTGLQAEAPVVLTASDPVDERLLRPLARELGCGFVGAALPVPQAIDLVANAAVYVTGRWHPSIFASLGGTPVVGISGNSFKVEAFQELIGAGRPTFAAAGLAGAEDDVVAAAVAAVAEGQDLRDRIRARADELRPQVSGHVDLLAARP